MLEVNCIPTSIAPVFVEDGFTGRAVDGHTEQGQMVNVNGSACDEPLSVAVT
jgi:hypothetical protein